MHPTRHRPAALAVFAAGLFLAASPVFGGTVVPSTGFESPQFTTGLINGQHGWIAESDAAVVSSVNPAAGDQHLRLGKDGSRSGPVRVASPVVADPYRRATVSVDLWIRDADITNENNATHEFAANDPGGVDSTFRVIFDFSGAIKVVDNLGGGSVMVDTGDRWNLALDGTGGYVNLAVVFDATGSDTGIDYFFNGASIYQGNLYGGSAIDEIVFKHNNFYTGTTADSETADWDNLSITVAAVPSPSAVLGGALGLLGLALRRR